LQITTVVTTFADVNQEEWENPFRRRRRRRRTAPVLLVLLIHRGVVNVMREKCISNEEKVTRSDRQQ